jgi:hypothetical protein
VFALGEYKIRPYGEIFTQSPAATFKTTMADPATKYAKALAES